MDARALKSAMEYCGVTTGKKKNGLSAYVGIKWWAGGGDEEGAEVE